jgi:bis(5'-nucleosyl)-tetraphosphatase (symmetrical)
MRAKTAGILREWLWLPAKTTMTTVLDFQMEMTTYAIGDLQGCANELEHLLEGIEAASPGARLVFVGDLVNRGPASLRTLRLIRALGDRARTVLGNHDLHLLAVSQGIRAPGRGDTLDDILQAPDRDELLDWLRRQPLALMADGHLVVHAGVLPQWTAGQVLALSAEVEAQLQGEAWTDFLRTMYGNEPARWHDDLQGADRWRCIVNALTRLRFCRTDGKMEFATKDGPGQPPAGYLPWFDVPSRCTAEVPVVFGHWSTLGLVQRENLFGLDSGCVWGGKLSAIRLADGFVMQVACAGYQKPGG